jgi:serine-type D-Ala-D-Ala carboxypeptidase
MRSARGILLLILAVTGCAPPAGPEADRVERQLGSLDTRQRLAQLLVVGPGIPPTLDEGRTPTAGALFDARVTLTVPAAEEEPEQIRPLLVADLFAHGVGGLTAEPEAVIASAAPAELRDLGRRAGRMALSHGVHLAIVRLRMDELVRRAAGGWSPEERVEAFLRGVADTGLPLAVEVYAAARESGGPVPWDLGRMEAVEGALVRVGARAGVAAMLPAVSSIPALTGDTLPLPFSPVVPAMLRRDHAWDGAMVVDLSRAAPLLQGRSEGEAAVMALAAGADLILAPAQPQRMLDALETGLRERRLDQQRVDEAVRRVLRLKLQAERARAPAATPAMPVAAVRDDAVVEAAAAPLVALPPEEVAIDPVALARADSALERALGQELFTAGAIAVARRGVIVHSRGFGSQPDGSPVSPTSTIFDVASLTKVMATTTAAALLVEEGRLGLDDRVRSHLPEFQGEGKEEVTVRHLLAHTSGLPAGLWLYGSARSPEAALQQVLRQRLRRPPGERAEYSDLGMILLSAVVESAAGEPIDRLLARRVFVPLGMSSTMYLPAAALRESVVPTAIRNERGFLLQGVVHDANAFRLGGVAGHAGLFSTALDVLVFGQMMLQGGSLSGVRILEPETVATFVRRQPGAETRALGWDTPADRSSAGRFFSARSFGHTGYTGTSLWIDPELGLVVVLLTNRTYDAGTPAGILALRRAVHDAVAAGVTDRPVTRRPGAR